MAPLFGPSGAEIYIAGSDLLSCSSIEKKRQYHRSDRRHPIPGKQPHSECRNGGCALVNRPWIPQPPGDGKIQMCDRLKKCFDSARNSCCGCCSPCFPYRELPRRQCCLAAQQSVRAQRRRHMTLLWLRLRLIMQCMHIICTRPLLATCLRLTTPLTTPRTTSPCMMATIIRMASTVRPAPAAPARPAASAPRRCQPV